MSALDHEENHHAALELLAEAGFYVLVKIGEDIHGPDLPRNNGQFNANFDTQPYYTAESITSSLRLVDQLADYPNILGFVLSGESLKFQSTTKIAEVVRAHIRDVKAFLRRRGGRRVPVGVSNSEILMVRGPAVRYFTAGPSESRIDFFAPDSWGWAHNSSFQISGWKNMVRSFEDVPVPMFLRQYGTYVGKERIWEEVECLYSSDMTGVFSGGCLYTFRDAGHNNYGIVEVDERGQVQKKPEYETLKRTFRTVNNRMDEELFGGHVKDYEEWEGEYPERKENRWMATNELPEFPMDLDEVMQSLQEKEVRSSEPDRGGVKALGDEVARMHLEN